MQIDLTNYAKDRNPHTGRFIKNSTPHNKGKPWSEWMDGRKKKKILKNLQHTGNPNLAGANAKKIIGIKNGKFCPFESSEDAGRKLGIIARNIRSCCNKKRKSCGGWKWFFENDNEWIKLIDNGN